MKTIEGDEELIKKLTENFVAAFNSGNVDAMMSNYVPDESFVIFDVVPRAEYCGAEVYRGYWLEMFSHFEGKPHLSIKDQGITVGGDAGFGYSFQHVTGKSKQGDEVNRTVRVTNGYRKIGDNWLIALEHVSIPVDLKTGMAVFQ
ncbi:YybH family protein [Mucilaginibacter calamicampi]|uniref:YybH family protein n=1 Tax=Mucilaginibacter calamicampi TaxID=1302352 RepID=A0ABW2YWR1_9SPHI